MEIVKEFVTIVTEFRNNVSVGLYMLKFRIGLNLSKI